MARKLLQGDFKSKMFSEWEAGNAVYKEEPNERDCEEGGRKEEGRGK